jgi:hypothetical protein
MERDRRPVYLPGRPPVVLSRRGGDHVPDRALYRRPPLSLLDPVRV